MNFASTLQHPVSFAQEMLQMLESKFRDQKDSDPFIDRIHEALLQVFWDDARMLGL